MAVAHMREPRAKIVNPRRRRVDAGRGENREYRTRWFVQHQPVAAVDLPLAGVKKDAGQRLAGA
jgi:hypothetical protein